MAHLPVASLRKKKAQIQTTNETLERVILSGWYPILVFKDGPPSEHNACSGSLLSSRVLVADESMTQNEEKSNAIS